MINHIILLIPMLLMSIFLWLMADKCLKYSSFLVYLFICLIYNFAILNTVKSGPYMLSVTFVACILVTPITFIGKPVILYFINVAAIAVFIFLTRDIKIPKVLHYDIVNLLIFGHLGIVINYNVTKIQIARLLSDRIMKKMSETDLLTGLRNRNSYEQMINSYPSICTQNLSCIYIDANGLHEINNTQSHAKGDEMLIRISEELQKAFDPDGCYRIGGDEFVVFAVDQIPSDISDKVKSLCAALTEIGYHISVGIHTENASHINMKDLIRKSEIRMYDDKRKYYADRNIDRRNRSIAALKI